MQGYVGEVTVLTVRRGISDIGPGGVDAGDDVGRRELVRLPEGKHSDVSSVEVD